MRIAFLLLLSISCAHQAQENKPDCYLFLGSEVIKIETQNGEAYLFGTINHQPMLYWERLNYINSYYLPLECSNKIIQEAKSYIKKQEELSL